MSAGASGGVVADAVLDDVDFDDSRRDVRQSLVLYRLERIAHEASGTASPNAIDSADLSAYTDEPAPFPSLDRKAAHADASGDGAAQAGSSDLPRALVIASGKELRAIAEAAARSGMYPCIVYTDDRPAPLGLSFPHERVKMGEVYSPELYSNAHAVLRAAIECRASVVLLAGDARSLSDVDVFISLAKARALRVFCAAEKTRSRVLWAELTTSRKPPEQEDWRTCPNCKLDFDARAVHRLHYRCPSCGAYYRMTSGQRIEDVLDEGSFEELDEDLGSSDPLAFPGYLDKLWNLRRSTGLGEAVCCGFGTLAGMDTACAVMDSSFLMGSMGYAVGEKLTRLFDLATERRLPVVVFTASGGARMQEGLVSLMQMAKVSCAVERHASAGLFYVSVITDPTTGGVTASFAMQGDIVIAEPGALIGFAGKRVIRDTIRQELPDDFQTAEFAQEHGLIDAIVPREQIRAQLANLLAIHTMGDLGGEVGASPDAFAPSQTDSAAAPDGADGGTAGDQSVLKSLGDWILKRLSPEEIAARREYGRVVKQRYETTSSKEAGDGLGAWASVQQARNVKRPTAAYYAGRMVDGFVELHGDRMFGDDPAIMAGVGWIAGRAVTVIAQEKGSDLKERIRRNFGCPQPEGYRKSLRLMRQAEKFGRPVVCLVDTQGAYCGKESEERGQGNAIADNLVAMAGLRVPVISVLIGEGGSGGALALALSNCVGMQENAVYSVLSPEGFASILWKDRTRAPEAAEMMRMSARQVYEMGIVDEVLLEGDGPAQDNPVQACDAVEAFVIDKLEEFGHADADALVAQRHARFAKY